MKNILEEFTEGDGAAQKGTEKEKQRTRKDAGNRRG
jgi:hypothetical protein